jgi:ribosomal protein S18 acetylase RimI-like enzyme
MSLAKDLFENHLEFFATHRGTVIRADGWVHVDSSASEFAVAFAEEGATLASLPARFTAVRLLPWSRLTTSELLADGFRANGALAYLTLQGKVRPTHAVKGLTIDVVRSETGTDIFTKVQANAFLEEGESFDWWYAWFRQKNHDGLDRELQRFYVASMDGEPASVAVSVLLDRVIGIYGVATLPEFRKRGVSSLLLARAIADAREKRSDAVALQVVKAGTYAQAFCEKIGFTVELSTPAFLRSSDPVKETNLGR